jgi:hypothetical protein
MKLLSLFTLFLLVVVATTLALIFQTASTHAGLPGHTELTDDETGDVPHPDDSPAMNTELTCKACSYSVRLMQGALEKVRVEFERQPDKLREYHALAAVEDVCKKNKLHVGLLSKNKEDVTTDFIHEVEAKQTEAGDHVLKGGWVTRFFYQKCEDMLTTAEDHMAQMMQGKDVNLCPACKKFEKMQKEKKTHADLFGKNKKKKNNNKKKSNKNAADL